MSANDVLMGVDLPSEDEEDSDYVTENEGSSSDEEEERPRSYKKDIRRQRASNRFDALMEKEDAKMIAETHSDVLVDPLWLALQKKVIPGQTPFHVGEVLKYCNIVKTEQPIDVKKYKQMARGEIVPSTLSVDVARAGLRNSHVEVSETVRFAGQTVQLTKRVTSREASKLEKRMQQTKTSSVDSYLSQLKAKRSVTSVEKSAADWNAVKRAGLAEVSDTGFLEKKAFLHRADERQDDLRRDMRRRNREAES